MSSRVTYIQKEKGEDSGGQIAEAASEAFGSLMTTIEGLGEGVLGLAKQFLQLPLSSPIMGAVLGILINDILSHKIDLKNWQHQETICLDCAGLTVNTDGSVTSSPGGPSIGTFINGFFAALLGPGAFAGFLLSNSQQAAQHAIGPTQAHNYALVWVPGLITNAANLQIAAIILTGFGTSEVGNILTSLASFTALVKGNTPSSSVTTPSVTTLGVPIVSEKAAKQ